MAGQPAISVLIPTYNRATFLPATLGSIFAQTVPVAEVILVDDGSTDNTSGVVESLLTQHPDWKSRLRYVRQENQGKSAALNTALRLATGQWVAFDDSDDTWLAEKLEWQFRALAKFPECGACFTESVSPDAPDLQGKEFQRARARHPECFSAKIGHLGKIQDASHIFCGYAPGIYMQSVIVRDDVMRQCGEFDPSLRIDQDIDFFFRLGLVTPLSYVELPLVEIHQDPKRTLGLTTAYPSTSARRLEVKEACLCKWREMIGRSRPELRRAIKHGLASIRSALANRYLSANDLLAARTVLLAGMRECFEFRLLLKWLMSYATPTLLRRLAIKRLPT